LKRLEYLQHEEGEEEEEEDDDDDDDDDGGGGKENGIISHTAEKTSEIITGR